MSLSKLIGCNVHDAIRVSKQALRIIDTPEFQRLRYIRQLGLCYFVYPAATHTRFEHSIGVYYLAGKMMEKIVKMYSDTTFLIPKLSESRIKITPKIIECVKIAGLCHDIGHGPFSHLFDDIILKDTTHPYKTHEARSCLITEIICKRELSDYLDNKDIRFIQSLISPDDNDVGAIYQIISNKLNGIDVDKFDYLVRDSKTLGIGTTVNIKRLVEEFIIDDHGNIAYPKHASSNIYDLFHSRYMMHKKVYCHKTVKILESMLVDIIVKLEPILKIKDSINSMSDFCNLTDRYIFDFLNIMQKIPSTITIQMDSDKLALINEAAQIYQRIITRNFYKKIIFCDDNMPETHIQDFLSYYRPVDREDFEIIIYRYGFVNGCQPDPFKNIYLYDNMELSNTFTIHKSSYSQIISNKISESRYLLICKNIEKYPDIMEAYAKYLSENNFL
jgi:deoxynucleoside triphosphate triphosphohydrolase SAMHD1